MGDAAPDNAAIADQLEKTADLLEMRDANPFRVRSYRDAAASVRECDRSVADMARFGKGLSLMKERI